MGTLHTHFGTTLEQLGLAAVDLPTAVFYHADVGIRFEIGGKEAVYLTDGGEVSPSYVEHAYFRAKTLFYDLPHRPDLLRIDCDPEEIDLTQKILSQMGLPTPDESIQEDRMDGEDCVSQEHLYWDLTKRDVPLNQLLLEIIKGDIGGFSWLCSNVYLLNTKCFLLYHLYDDRGADIVAKDRTFLLLMYQKYNDWILPHDKAKIDRLFSDFIEKGRG